MKNAYFQPLDENNKFTMGQFKGLSVHIADEKYLTWLLGRWKGLSKECKMEIVQAIQFKQRNKEKRS
jgi:hypothetical protein